MEILAKLIDVIIEFLLDILPCRIIRENEHGVLLRVGKFKKVLDGGFVWKIPVFDEVILCKNTVTTLSTPSQTLTTTDNKSLTIESVVKYKISNPKKFLLEVNDATDAISDITQSKIKQLLAPLTWEQAKDFKDNDLKEMVAKECSEWGIKVLYVTIVSLSQARVYKVHNSNEH